MSSSYQEVLAENQKLLAENKRLENLAVLAVLAGKQLDVAILLATALNDQVEYLEKELTKCKNATRNSNLR